MIATATALISATEEAIFDEEAMGFAQALTHQHNDMTQEDFAKAMFIYAAMLTSTAIDKATKVLLTETQLTELMTTIDEIESMRNVVLEENN